MSSNPQLAASCSRVPAFPAEQAELYRRVLASLQAQGIGFAVAGAFAFQRYTGIWRFTKDLDLFLPRAEVPRALALCRQIGFNTEVRDPVWLAKAWHDGYFVDLISGMSNGAIWVTPEWIGQAVRDTVLDQSTLVLAAEDLILSKLFVTRRDRFDGSDIVHLLHARGPVLDWPRLLRAAEPFWQLLWWHLILYDYIYPQARERVPEAVWTHLQARWLDRCRGGEPAPEQFRGALIDDQMFAIDLYEWGAQDLQAEFRRRRLVEGAGEAA